MDPIEIMTGYERRLAAGKRKSAADLLKDDKMVATAVKDLLGSDVERKLETGEIVEIPLVYDLLIDLFAYWKQNPSKIDVKVLSSVLGETKVEVSASTENASDIFGGIASAKREAPSDGTDPG